MSSPAPSHSITELEFWNPHREVCPVTTQCPVCRSVRVLAWNTRTASFGSFFCSGIISSGLFYSVLSPNLGGTTLQPLIEETNYEVVPTLFGIECALVRLRIGLPIQDQGPPRPFTLLALLPMQQIRDAPRMIHLGAQFLEENRIRLELDHASHQGRLFIPWQAQDITG